MKLLVILISFIDNTLRYLGSFLYQTSAPVAVVKSIYELTALSSLLLIIWFVVIPIASRAAYYNGRNQLILGLYRKTMFFLFSITCLALIVQGTVIVSESFDAKYITVNIFLLVWFGTSLSLLKAQSKIIHLSLLRVMSSMLYLGVMLCGMVLGFNLLYVLIGIILSSLLPSIFAEILIGKVKRVSVKLRRFRRWMVTINLHYKSMIIQSAALITIINIDRLIVSGTGDAHFVAQYAIATSICAPIIIIGNVLGLDYFTRFIKRHSTEGFLGQILTSACYAFGGVILCWALYFSLIALDLFEDRIPSVKILAVVTAYYYMYVISQFLFFYTAVNKGGIKHNLGYMALALLIYYLEPTSLYALKLILLIGIFSLTLGALSVYQTPRELRGS
jgi:hypothetical protein